MKPLYLASALLLLGASGTLAAPAERQLAQSLTTEQALGAVITAVERRILEDYYHHQAAPPPGQGKNKNKAGKGLPPGLAKKGRLPPGLAKRELPPDLYRRLPPRAHGRFYIVDNRIVLIEAATNVVLDLLEDVVAGH